MAWIKQLSGKNYSVFYFGALLFIVISTGCLSGSSTVIANPTIIATPPPAITPDTTNPSTIFQTHQVTSIPTMTVVQTSRQTISDEIKTHFMDIAFGDNPRINRKIPWEISTGSAGDNDIELIQNFILEFNDISKSERISENMRDGATGDLKIKFISQEGMNDISSDLKTFKSNGVTTAKIDSGSTIYLNNNLKGDQRNHTILRSLYYALGVKGETLIYSDSLFFYEDTNNTGLTFIDKKAIEILFEQGLYNGMSVEDVKKVIYFE